MNSYTQSHRPLFFKHDPVSLSQLLHCPSANCSPPMWHRYPLCPIVHFHVCLLETDPPLAGTEAVFTIIWLNTIIIKGMTRNRTLNIIKGSIILCTYTYKVICIWKYKEYSQVLELVSYVKLHTVLHIY